MRILAPLLLAACATDVAPSLPNDQAPPPLVLSSTPFDPGTRVTLTVSGAAPNANVVIGYSLDGLSDAFCPAPLAGGCLGIAAPVQELRRARADANGELTVFLPLPAAPPVDRAWFQAVQLGANVQISNVLDGTVRIDSDGDGLFDADERDLGLDPNLADSDGGGVDDGDELAAQTDPLLPGDDALGALGTVDVDLDLDIVFSGALAGLACTFGGVCDCSATYGGAGNVVSIDGTSITFFGTWEQTSSTCATAVGLEDRVWEASSGAGYHTLTLSPDGTALQTWVAHSSTSNAAPTADPYANEQFVADAIGVAFTTPATSFSGTVSESDSGVTATTTTSGTFTFGP